MATTTSRSSQRPSKKNGQGRPRRYGKRVYFGMQVTPEERRMIHSLAAGTDKPEGRVVLDILAREYERRMQRRYTPSELRALPPEERKRILAQQADTAADYYTSPGAVVDSTDDITDY